MKPAYEDDALLVNMIDSEGMTQGRCYRVVSSYDGHSGCGAQQWTRVADDTGRVIGFDPSRFIPAAGRGDGLKGVLSTALRMHRRLKKMREGLGNGDLTQALRTKLDDQIEDITSIIAAASLDPAQDQITFQDVSGGSYERGLMHEVIVGVDGREVGRMQVKKGADTWALSLEGAPFEDLGVGQYHEAIALVSDRVRTAAGDSPLGFWALTVEAERVVEAQAVG
jgi:hypothetical protein